MNNIKEINITNLDRLAYQLARLEWLQWRLAHQSKAVEWVRCLVSPRHARTTWLRVDPVTEAKYLANVKRVVIALFIGVAFVAGIIYGQYRVINYLKAINDQPTIQVQLREA